jgi:outer membrane protein OmpA-like peptidoglycan-associated protein
MSPPNAVAGVSEQMLGLAQPGVALRRLCPVCVLAAAVVLLLAGLLAIGFGAARPIQLQQQAQAVAAERLSAAGFPWARLDIQGQVGRLAGEAPDAEARDAAWTAAPRLLDDLVGWTGVVKTLDNVSSVSPCGARLHAALALPAVRFAAGSHHLDPFAEPLLAELAEVLGRCERWQVVIEASVDGSALEAGLRRLGLLRAQAVAAALMLQGVPVEVIESRVAARVDASRRVAIHVEHELGR